MRAEYNNVCEPQVRFEYLADTLKVILINVNATFVIAILMLKKFETAYWYWNPIMSVFISLTIFLSNSVNREAVEANSTEVLFCGPEKQKSYDKSYQTYI